MEVYWVDVCLRQCGEASYTIREMSDRVETAERIVQDLSPDELSEFASWFADFHAQMWDAEIERDSLAGRFDAMIKRAHEDFKNGLANEL
jgi:predicted nucleic acid-binding protein